MRTITVMTVALLLAGCATINYLSAEYGTGPQDGEVAFDDGRTFWVWQHKSKRKLLISVDPSQAAAIGMVQGLTFGGVSGAVPPPIFEDVARRWFIQTSHPECPTVKGYPIETVYFEFEFECAPPTLPAKSSRRRR